MLIRLLLIIWVTYFSFWMFVGKVGGQIKCTIDGRNFCIGDSVIPTPGRNGLIPKLTPNGDEVPNGVQLESATGVITGIDAIEAQAYLEVKWNNGIKGWTSDDPGTLVRAPAVAKTTDLMPGTTALFYVSFPTNFELLIPKIIEIYEKGGLVQVPITINVVSGNQQPITLSISGVPDGITVTFDPPSCTPPCTSIMTIIGPPLDGTGI